MKLEREEAKEKVNEEEEKRIVAIEVWVAMQED